MLAGPATGKRKEDESREVCVCTRKEERGRELRGMCLQQHYDILATRAGENSTRKEERGREPRGVCLQQHYEILAARAGETSTRKEERGRVPRGEGLQGESRHLLAKPAHTGGTRNWLKLGLG